MATIIRCDRCRDEIKNSRICKLERTTSITSIKLSYDLCEPCETTFAREFMHPAEFAAPEER